MGYLWCKPYVEGWGFARSLVAMRPLWFAVHQRHRRSLGKKGGQASMPPRYRESSPHRAESTFAARYGLVPSARHASPLLWEHRISRWLARQLSYAFEQSALQIKMKDFATYTTLKREAMEFDEVRIRWQTQLVTRVRRSHTGPCNARPLQPADHLRARLFAAGACLFPRRQPAI